MWDVATRAVVVVIAVGGITATALAATRGRPEAATRRPPHQPAPKILRHPKAKALSARAKFAFSYRDPAARFECRLDDGRWRACKTSIVFVDLTVGRHRFSVRAVDRRGRRGAIARFLWTVLEAKDFSIAPDLSELDKLYPGGPPVEIALTVTNRNPVPISITGLAVSVKADPAGCASGANLALAPSGASKSSPLKVPPHGSVRLPTGRVHSPSIQLRDLPVNQDGCQNVSFPLEFSGSARG